ncbi:ATP-binding protein [Ketobacter alkanivorans]|uniref:Biotin carboxylase n=1 Tax=Ketobacter alkanivorans TaxID=1917421 RepID=A0A2K9LJ43_9GAMM|nr:biotin/lipoyl-containing protein [Ketobacter alkanivorans]AUM12257.1 biotin carboxylase [Ketobacter alkanivorans]
MSNENYTNNPLVNKDRRRQSTDSAWVSQFDCSDMKPLIICRGPIRKEVMDVWEEMGITDYGILLSEKDSITYNNALAPELRQIANPDRIHRVPDYTGMDKDERTQRIQQIITMAKENGHDSVFAGYGFMAEDEALVSALEKAGLNFIGPCSATVRGAGAKDEAKRTALANDVSTTPGIDNLTSLTLIRKVGDRAGLKSLADEKGLSVDAANWDETVALEDAADAVLNASYAKSLDIISTDEICAEAIVRVAEVFGRYPENRVRLKAIGGGGGKGQRILQSPAAFEGDLDVRIKAASEVAAEKLIEILQEVKTTGVGDNKNVLIELNIETTRHQEIQVIGNGEWCTTLGARDCSLQMHEQKLLEISNTSEMLEEAIARAEAEGKAAEVEALKTDLDILKNMELESERFGAAVGLDSVSTFECIVDKGSHFFMEMNTRIQVEHRVSELCYSLKFVNPEDPNDFLIVDSLVEAMTLLARHGKKLPKPERIPRERASVEARLNATNDALKPHAGGVIEYWSSPIANEIRDDQGISARNPDTGQFIKYHLAGAYDSNIALLLSVGQNRKHSYEEMAELLRRTRMSGENLATNLQFHYGLVHWFLAENVHAKSTTKFVMPYLTLVGLVKEAAADFDLEYAFNQAKGIYKKQIAAAHGAEESLQAAMQAIDASMERKHTLLLRALDILTRDPHVFSGWLSLNKANVQFDSDSVVWTRNPVQVLDDTYHYLNMDYRADLPAAECIWKHDNEILQKGLQFYRELEEKLGESDWLKLNALLAEDAPQAGMDEATWTQVQAAHLGFQSGMEVVSALPKLASEAGFYDLKVNEDLTVFIPESLHNEELQARMMKVLVPPPATKADEIVAVSGGMFYGREVPGAPTFVEVGDHVEAGQPIYIIEVMKMFNKVVAPFACTIDKVLLENVDGAIVKQGQPLFKVTPDEKMVEVDPAEVKARRRARTEALMTGLI